MKGRTHEDAVMTTSVKAQAMRLWHLMGTARDLCFTIRRLQLTILCAGKSNFYIFFPPAPPLAGNALSDDPG